MSLAALFILALLLTPSSLTAPSQEAFLRLRVESLTVAADLYSVSVSGDKVVAVGKAGTVVIAGGGRFTVLSAASSDLVSVSCSERLCVAVGGKGALVEIDPHEEAYRAYTVSQSDLLKIVLKGQVAAVAARTEVLVYRVGKGVLRTFSLGADVTALAWSGDMPLAAAGGRILSLNMDTGGASIVKEYKSLKILAMHLLGGRLWLLTDKGVTAEDGEVMLSGAFSGMEPVSSRSLVLYQSQSITLFDVVDRKQVQLAYLQTKVNHVAAYGASLAVVGPAGYLAFVEKSVEKRLTAPSAGYTAAASDGRGGVLIAAESGLLLHYRDGVFSSFLIGDQPRAVTYAYGDMVVLGSRSLWVFDGGEIKSVETAVKASDYVDIAPGRLWVTLVGRDGKIAEVGRRGEIETVQATTSNLLAVTQGYAVGEKVAVMIGDEPRVSKQDSKLVDVVATSCGAVAVSDAGDVVYLRPETITKSSLKNKPKLTAVSLNPRGAYVLAGGSRGELVLYDGYNATLLPAALPEEVRAIAWIDDKTAIAVTSKAVYRVVELWYPPPSLDIRAPRSMDVFSGSSRKVEVTLVPMNGYSGEAEVLVSVSGLSQYVSVQPKTLSAKLSPLCPAKATLTVNIYSEAPEGVASIALQHGDSITQVALKIAKPGPASQQQAPLIGVPEVQLLAGLGIAGLVGYMAISRTRRKNVAG